MELLRGRGHMEVEIAAEDLIRTLSGEHHLDAHRLYLSGQEIHRGRSAYGRHVECLKVMDDIPDGIQPFLHGERYAVVHGADVLSHLAGELHVGRAFEAY